MSQNENVACGEKWQSYLDYYNKPSTPVHPFLGIWKIGANLTITRESLQGKNAHHRQQNYGGGNLVSAYGVSPALQFCAPNLVAVRIHRAPTCLETDAPNRKRKTKRGKTHKIFPRLCRITAEFTRQFYVASWSSFLPLV